MRTIIYATGYLLLIGSVFAQNPLQKSDFQINGGFGFSNWGFPVYFGFDYGISHDISAGGEFTYRSYNEDIGGQEYDHNVIGISCHGNVHFGGILNIESPWDLYAGINIGYYIWDSPGGYGGSHGSKFGVGAQAGGRYYLLNTLGINLEFHGGENTSSGGKLGITPKF